MKIQARKWLIVIATLVSLMFVVTGLEAKKPEKPDKPDQIKAECIVFTGALDTVEGSEVIEGCCPNAGPFPVYGMTVLGEDYVGELFINNYGAGRDHSYIVQFWNEVVEFEIIGGVIDNDKKNKVLTVTFVNEEATLWRSGVGETYPFVTFDLVRKADPTDCP